MQNNNFAATLASVASEFGVEDTAKHGRGIKPSKRPYFRWTDEQLEQLATLRDEGKSANEIAEALGVSRDKSSPSWPPWQHVSGQSRRQCASRSSRPSRS